MSFNRKIRRHGKGVSAEVVLREVLEEMCKRVGATDFSKAGWYLEKSWDEEAKNEFRDWLRDYLYNSPRKAKALFPMIAMKDKKQAELAAINFVANYGWRDG
jgi:hypothetical protein